MKLLRIGHPGNEQPAALDSDGQLRDLSALVSDINGAALDPAVLARLQQADLSQLPVIEQPERIAPCVGGVGKLICVGLNYSDHAAEAGMQLPREPVLFFKATSAICGCQDPLQIPRGSEKTDWEVELGVVIGSRAKYISREQAAAHIAGYCVVNDLSERAFQLEREGQWVKGKSHDSFAPIGPWLVTADEAGDPQNLDLWTYVNDAQMQAGNTRTMAFGVYELVSYISQFMTLEPGDIISTGTPIGVGMGQQPQRFLKTGDRVRVGITGLGEQHQQCVSA